ncbi:PVL ORF-50 family protein [Staphylococcus gallinarum]|uniref:PVL ORF-50 family protein n=1 Tax=Staphylococcus gallinarum TaxID=1293 RepID=A0A380FD17_STAGA|nr:PVL ORF-50 family protein [Staphylococcus gallinarum]
METMSIRGKVYEIPDTYLEQANLNGVSWQRIYQRLVRNKGWTIKEACFAPEGMKLGEYRQIVRMKEREEREKNAYSNLLEEKTDK